MKGKGEHNAWMGKILGMLVWHRFSGWSESSVDSGREVARDGGTRSNEINEMEGGRE